MIVYLAGPINGCTDSQCKDWRAYAKEKLRCATLDPMRRDYRGRELEPGIAATIVHEDEADVRACDVVLANHPHPSTGTDMEIRMAKAEFKKFVITVTPANTLPSPWLLYHSDVLAHSMDEAIRWINGRVL